MSDFETTAVRALCDLIHSGGGTLHDLRMIVANSNSAARKEALEDERERIRVCLDRIDLQGLYDLFAMFEADDETKGADHG